MAIPNNIIIAWSGSIGSIPSGWFLCDGQNGTPDLRNRFIAAAGSKYSLSSVGGNKDAVNIAHSHGGGTTSFSSSHSHTIPLMVGGNPGTINALYDFNYGNTYDFTSSSGSHSHSMSISTVGESGTDKNMPPYMALAFIMYGGN